MELEQKLITVFYVNLAFSDFKNVLAFIRILFSVCLV